MTLGRRRRAAAAAGAIVAAAAAAAAAVAAALGSAVAAAGLGLAIFGGGRRAGGGGGDAGAGRGGRTACRFGRKDYGRFHGIDFGGLSRRDFWKSHGWVSKNPPPDWFVEQVKMKFQRPKFWKEDKPARRPQKPRAQPQPRSEEEGEQDDRSKPPARRVIRDIPEQEVPFAPNEDILDCLHSKPRLGLLLRVIEETLKRGLLEDKDDCKAALLGLGRGQGPEKVELPRLAEAVLHQMWKHDVPVDVEAWGWAMKACATGGGLQRALSLLNEALRRGIKQDTRVFTPLITALGNAGHGDRAVDLFGRMRQANITPDARGYIATIQACEKSRLWKEAVQLLEHASKSRVDLDASAYANAMSACQRANNLEMVERLLADMLDEGMKPNIATYNVLIRAYNGAFLPDEALRVWDIVQENQLKPETATYNAVIEAHGLRRDPQSAQNAYRELRDYEFKPDRTTFLSLVNALVRTNKRADHEMAGKYLQTAVKYGAGLGAYEQMRRDRIIPTKGDCLAALMESRETSWQDMAAVVEQMVRFEYTLGKVGYSLVEDHARLLISHQGRNKLKDALNKAYALEEKQKAELSQIFMEKVTSGELEISTAA